jgi:hypothetical protein
MNYFIFVMFLFFGLGNARADWTELSVTYDCDDVNKTFSLDSTVNSSYLPRVHGYGQEIPKGINRSLECILSKGRVVELNYTSVGPQASGMCRAAGYSEIYSLKVNNNIVLGRSAINSGCFTQDTLVSVKIQLSNSDILLEKCTVVDWDQGEDTKRNCLIENLSANKSLKHGTPPIGGAP